MPNKPTVLQSINAPNGDKCVDLFQRPDGSYGFEEYRRDVEDVRGWFPIGGYAGISFARREDAFCTALRKVQWLKTASHDS